MARPPAAARKRRPVRRDPAESRDRILGAAASFLGNEGYEAMTSARVARKAGVSEGLLYHHFGSKRGILAAVAGQLGEGAFESAFSGTAVEGGAAADGAEAMLASVFAFARENRALVRAFARLSNGEHRDLAESAVRERIEAALADLLVRQEDAGRVRPMRPEIVARLVFGIVTAGLTGCFVDEDGSRETEWLQETVRCVHAAVARKGGLPGSLP